VSRHTTVKARELRKGDLLRLGVSTSYVLVASAVQGGGEVHVTVYNGTTPYDQPTLHYAPGQELQLARRDFPA
jgi:hypothetical protein